jgi:CheY-like chemotaxis protein
VRKVTFCAISKNPSELCPQLHSNLDEFSRGITGQEDRTTRLIGTLTVPGNPDIEDDMITIVLADRSNITRYGLRTLLDGHPDFRIVGEAAGPWETIQCLSQLKPNVLILDWSMARRGGMEVLRRLKHKSPSTQIVLFSLDWSESQFLDMDESKDVELIYCDFIGTEIMRAIRDGNLRRPCLIALTPPVSAPRCGASERRNPVATALAARGAE